MGGAVKQLVKENGVVSGVRYLGPDGWHELRAPLTAGADGRFSQLRRLAGIDPLKTSPPLDVLGSGFRAWRRIWKSLVEY